MHFMSFEIILHYEIQSLDHPMIIYLYISLHCIGNVRYWKRAGEQPKPVNSWYYIAAMSAEVEMTAYALLATLQFYDEEAITNSQPTAFWLSNQQSSSGGFSSTQVDTLLYTTFKLAAALLIKSYCVTN